MSKVTDETKLGGIASKIYAVMAPIFSADDTAREARELATAAGENKLGVREAMLINVAKISADAKLSKADVDRVATLVAKANNDDSRAKTLATLCAEFKNAAHPLVRDHVPAMVKMINEVWLAEQEAWKADKSTPKPVWALFKRRYHVMTGLFKQAAGGKLIDTAEALIAYARANDPNLDAERIHKKLGSIISQLQDFHHDFAHDDIGAAIDVLNRITADELKDTLRAKVIAVPADDNVDNPAAEPIPTVVEPNTTSFDTSMGAIDIDDLLNDSVGLAQAA